MKILLKLEQLERLHSEDTQCHPMITHIIDSSQVKTRQSHSYTFKEIAKT